MPPTPKPPPSPRSRPADALVRVHQWYYDAKPRTWGRHRWLGVPVQKAPWDLWAYQELITRLRPAWIIETGTLHGGSALFFATVCEALGHGQVLSIDTAVIPTRAQHPRITYLQGSSVDPALLLDVYRRVLGAGPRLVSLDSDHTPAHVYQELVAYAPLVTPGSYCVVEDSNLGTMVWPAFGPGPALALRRWLRDRRPPFVRDRVIEPPLSFHPGGWLRRVDG